MKRADFLAAARVICDMGDHETELKLRRTPPPVHLPLKRSFLSVLAVSVGASSVGYALGYPSSALIDLQRLPDRRAFENGSVESQLFVVRNIVYPFIDC